MATCYNCPKDALYVVEMDGHRVPLCLDCAAKHQQMVDAELANHERELNWLADQMDTIAGLPRHGPRYPPRPQPVVIQGTTFHNVNVQNSSVGLINTGQLHQVDSAITVIGSQGDKQLAQALKSLTEAVVCSANLKPAQKNEAVELLSTIGQEAAAPEQQRRNSVGRMLASRLQEVLSTAADIATVATAAIPIIAAAFGS